MYVSLFIHPSRDAVQISMGTGRAGEEVGSRSKLEWVCMDVMLTGRMIGKEDGTSFKSTFLIFIHCQSSQFSQARIDIKLRF
jgi:hypothetical protein